MKTAIALLCALAAGARAFEDLAPSATFELASTYTMGGGCPNECSSHGYCRAHGKCFCFAGWAGFDCAQRECAFGKAWGVNDGIHQRPVECSYKGVCDRGSGECQCFEGYEGPACERTTCPNDCSGHGKCRMVQDLPLYADPATGTTTWDERMLQACVCDGGFFGPDCSLRYCPFGDDPITQCDRDTINEQVLEVRVSSKLDLTSATGDQDTLFGLIGNEFQLSFRDSANTNFTTRRVAGAWGYSAVTTSIDAATLDAAFTADTASAARIEAALESLPNFAVRDVTVTHESTDVTVSQVFNTFEVTFRHLEDGQNNYGKQNLACNTNNVCAGPGCQPRVRQSYFLAQWESDASGGGGLEVDSDALLATLDTDVTDSTAPYLRIHADSVLACPVGETCTAQDADTPMGAIALIFEADNDKVYGKAVGANNLPAGLFAANLVVFGGSLLEPDITALSGYTYLGVITAANKAKFDISAIVPNTYIQVDTLPTVVTTDVAVVLFYQPVTCTVTDVSESGSAFTNLDVENIECSGRGECDRSAGQCSCFEGYTGVACEVQTTIV